MKYVLKRFSFGSIDCTEEQKLECASFLGQTSWFRPCSAAHNFERKTILQSIIAFPVTFKDLMEPVFNQALKAGHVGFVTDKYIQCISSSL